MTDSSTKTAAREAVTRYYELAQSNDVTQMESLFEADATIKLTLDYGGFQPNDEYEYSVSDPSAMQGDDGNLPFSDTSTEIQSVEQVGSRTIVTVAVEGTYEYQGSDGKTTGQDIFELVLGEQGARIARYECTRGF